LTSPIFSVLPKDNQVLAHLIVPPHGAGKIKKGQSVVIKLVSYPYQECEKIENSTNHPRRNSLKTIAVAVATFKLSVF
jgi:hypothetical protein